MSKTKQKTPIELTVLEAAITTAVRRSDPNCEGFVGVVVGECHRKSIQDSNWTIRGIRFGTAKRESCNSAISLIVDRLQQQFEIKAQ
jgi:hypothetical protein